MKDILIDGFLFKRVCIDSFFNWCCKRNKASNIQLEIILPWHFQYLFWINYGIKITSIVTTLAAATFTLFYSLMWGKEVAEQWLSSILISNGQDIFVVQPTKVMLAVVLISLLMTKPQKNNSQDSNDDVDSVSCEIDLLSDNPKERFKRSRLEAIRERTKKEVKLAGMTKEIVIHLTFVFFLVVVCYGNKTQYRIMMTTTLLDPFAKFDLVRKYFYIITCKHP